MQIKPTFESLRILLDNLVDYAGLFPPASLDLGSSIRNYARYLTGADEWMLRSFVCPAARLNDLAGYRDALAPHTGVRVTALGPAATNRDSWNEACASTLRVAEEFDTMMGGVASVRAFEMKLPSSLAARVETSADSLNHLFDAAAPRGPADWFVEVVPASDDPRNVARTLHKVAGDYPELRIGLKLRTGGVTPAEVPTASAVAQFICACRDVGVPFKATAGLHHPLYHFSDDVGANMHGFLNVFVGSLMAAVHGFDATVLEGLLQVSHAASLKWSDNGVVFGGYEASRDDIARARRDLAVSFGSCSFDEPREDLLTLGLATPLDQKKEVS